MTAKNDTLDADAIAPGARKPVPRRPLPIVQPWWTIHRKRKLVHIVCFLVFLTLPFFDVMRFDIPAQKFFFAGAELRINEFAILFFSLMFLMFVIVAASMLYGRIYCGYACPQMIFGEAFANLEERIARWVNKRYIRLPAARRRLLARALFYPVLGVASVFLSFVFISYFVEPRDLFWRLMSLDVQTAGGIAGATVTLITFLDFAFVRQKFCTTVCPYGYLQGLLGDGNTLVVHYRDEAHECVKCKKCVRVCHMGIDIRDSPYQIECIHCGECIDACAEIMGKLGKQTLIHYAWGDKGEVLGDTSTQWYKRAGLRDAKRVVVALVILFYAAGLATALSMRKEVQVRIAPVRTTLFRVGDDGLVYNRFRMSIANRGDEDATVAISVMGLPVAHVPPEAASVHVKAGEEVAQEFEVGAPASAVPPGVNPIEVVSRTFPGDETETFPMTFITPTEKKK